MGKTVRSDTKPAETTNLGFEFKSETVKRFNAIIKKRRLPMYIVLETFMRQFCNGSFQLKETDILKFERDMKNTHMVHTMVNKEIYADFKRFCKYKNYPIRCVISAFLEKFSNENYVLELKSTSDK
ncbi:MAG: hypothetical protein IJ299_03200 [Oscillospiraceae bacterium]|nr:hypothetical protein [Oscillospiraceae bacterium]